MRIITEAASRTLATQLTGLFKQPSKHPVNIISPTLCEQALSRLDLSAYKNSILVDMAPGVCTWSAALHDALQPRAHILLEPDKAYRPWIKQFQATRPNAYWLPEHGERWGLYMDMFGQPKPPPKWPRDYPNIEPRTVPPEDGVNTDIIFTGNLSGPGTAGDRLLAQFIATIPRERWLMTYGRVRFLVWIRDEAKVRYVPRTVAGRIRATVMAEAVCDVTEVASSNTIAAGRGYPRISAAFATDEHGNTIVEEEPAPEENPEESAEMQKPKRGRPKGEKLKKALPAEPTQPEAETAPKKRKRRTRKELAAAAAAAAAAAGEAAPRHEENQSLDELLTLAGSNPRSAALPHATLLAIITALREAHNLPTEPPLTPGTAIYTVRELARELLAHPLTERQHDVLHALLIKLKDKERWHRTAVQRLAERLTEFWSDPANEGVWIEGMDHPAWFYKDNVPALAEAMISRRREHVTDTGAPGRVGSNMRVTEFDELFGALERPEETLPPPAPPGAEKIVGEYNRHWELAGMGAKDPQVGIREDEIFSYEHGLLEYHRRKFEPITVQPSDFFPETPLALMDFTPKLVHPHLRRAADRDKTWETFSWLLRTLFLLRAHSISSALATLAPGGAHILDGLEGLDPERRIRTLSADQLIEIARAWEEWPFADELLHLEEWAGSGKEAEVLGGGSVKMRVKNLKF